MSPQSSELPSAQFVPFGAEHFFIVSGFLGLCVVMAVLGRRQRGTGSEVKFRRGFALVILCFTIPMQVVQLLPSDYSLGTSLPLQLCDFAWIAAVVALWTRHWSATALVYYWGLTLTVQGIITPTLVQPFPDLRYIGFWGMHFCTVWAAVYLTFGLRVAVTWRSYRFAVLTTATWAALVMTFNAAAGTNYGYLNRKPAVGTLLDLFGPWPAYVVVEIVLACTIWALMTWPWTRRKAGPASSGRESTGRGADEIGDLTHEHPPRQR